MFGPETFKMPCKEAAVESLSTERMYSFKRHGLDNA